MDIFFTRHAKTSTYDESPSKIEDAQTVLTTIGRQQTYLIAQRLKHLSPERVIASSQQRAIETAKLIKEVLNIDLEIRNDLVEQKRGTLLDNVRSSKIKDKFPEEWSNWQSGNQDYAPPGGESINEFLSRVEKVLKSFENKSGKIIIVTHFGFIQGVVCKILGSPFKFTMPLIFEENSITRVQILDKQRTIISINDTAHLQIPFNKYLEKSG